MNKKFAILMTVFLSSSVCAQGVLRYIYPYDAEKIAAPNDYSGAGAKAAIVNSDPYFSAPRVAPQPIECPLVVARRLELSRLMKKREASFSANISNQLKSAKIGSQNTDWVSK